MEKNYWDEFEYSKLKLLMHKEKVDSILNMKKGIIKMDRLFPISVEMHLTDCCNLRCEWCTDKELRKNAATMSYNNVISLLLEMKKNKTGVTIEGGGEPTLHPEFKKIAIFGEKNDVDMGLITNGTNDISDCISAFKWVRISLDSSNEKEYIGEKGVDKFNNVLENIKKMCVKRKAKDTFIGVGYVLTKRNQESLLEVIDKLDAIGVDYIYLRPVEEAPDIQPTIENLLDLRKLLAEFTQDKRIKYMLTINDRVIDKNAGLPCFSHTLTAIIHANGDVALCEKRRQDPIVLGNINEHTFEEIWESDYHMEVSEKLMNPCSQNGCAACRITGFNMILNQLSKVHTEKFI